jgi:ubiquinone/menaquinone biosynthesis C-methylase UbiE
MSAVAPAKESAVADSNHGFSEEWVQDYAGDMDRLSGRQLAAAMRCTYLKPGVARSLRRVLDAGCGGGYQARYLEAAGQGSEYTGIDQSEASLAEARRRFPGRRFLRADARRLPFADNEFDLAYSRDVLIHADAPYAVLGELYRVARYVLLRIRVAEVPALFTARYRRRAFVHQFFPLDEMLDAIASLSPAPKWIRYAVSTWRRRAYDASQFHEAAPFATYQAADLFIAKGASPGQTPAVIDDSNYTVLQALARGIRGGPSVSLD